jgi:DNA-binding NarL/FixJ family response regulator
MAYSERTVKNIVRSTLTQLNARNRAHAVALATRGGLI